MNGKELRKNMEIINNMEKHYRREGAIEELEKLKQEKYIFDGDLAQYVKLRMLELRK